MNTIGNFISPMGIFTGKKYHSEFSDSFSSSFVDLSGLEKLFNGLATQFTGTRITSICP
jgi:hypothetical protein